MWYMLKVDALIGAFVFSGAGLIMLAMFAVDQIAAYASARQRLYRRVANLVSHPGVFGSPVIVSRGGGK